MMWPYTQAEHDLATEQGGIGAVVTVALIVVVALIVLAWA